MLLQILSPVRFSSFLNSEKRRFPYVFIACIQHSCYKIYWYIHVPRTALATRNTTVRKAEVIFQLIKSSRRYKTINTKLNNFISGENTVYSLYFALHLFSQSVFVCFLLFLFVFFSFLSTSYFKYFGHYLIYIQVFFPSDLFSSWGCKGLE